MSVSDRGLSFLGVRGVIARGGVSCVLVGLTHQQPLTPAAIASLPARS